MTDFDHKCGILSDVGAKIKINKIGTVYTIYTTVLHTTVGPTNVYKKSEGQIM